MNTTWVPDFCTLPTRERPLRVAEFDAAFARGLRVHHRDGPCLLRLTLDASVEREMADLIERESACCSFFTFSLRSEDDRLLLDIAVPPGREDVLDALTTRLIR
jgi:hypothetical protein